MEKEYTCDSCNVKKSKGCWDGSRFNCDECLQSKPLETLPKEGRKQALTDMMKLDEQEGNYQQPKEELTIEELSEQFEDFCSNKGISTHYSDAIFNWFKPRLKQE